MSKARIGIWGCGGYSGFHARKLAADPEVEVAALCSRSEDNMRSLLESRLSEVRPEPEFYTDPEQMLAEAGLDGVVIITPHSLHLEHASLALDAGVHVLLEKPMVMNTHEAGRLVEKVRSSGRQVLVGYNTPYTSAYRYLRQAIKDERLGALQLISGCLFQNWKEPTSGTWRQDPSMSGGGIAFDSGAHLLGGICFAVGREPESVSAIVDNRGAEVDITAAAVIRFEGDVTASVAIDGDCGSNGSRATYMFEKGRIDIDGWGGSWIEAFEGREEFFDLPEGEAECSPHDNLVDVIKGETEPACGVEFGLIMAKLMDAFYDSADKGEQAVIER